MCCVVLECMWGKRVALAFLVGLPRRNGLGGLCRNLHQNSSTFPKPTFSRSQHDHVPPLTPRRTALLFFRIYTSYGDPSDCSSVDHDGCCRRCYNYWNYLRCGTEGTARSQTGMFSHRPYLRPSYPCFYLIRTLCIYLLLSSTLSSFTYVHSCRNNDKSSKPRRKNESHSSKSRAPN